MANSQLTEFWGHGRLRGSASYAEKGQRLGAPRAVQGFQEAAHSGSRH